MIYKTYNVLPELNLCLFLCIIIKKVCKLKSTIQFDLIMIIITDVNWNKRMERNL